MRTFFFWAQGAGEFSLMRPVMDLAIKNKNKVLLALDSTTLRILSPEEVQQYKPFIYDLQNGVSVESHLQFVNAIEPDVFVMQPSRGWQTQLKGINAKVKATIEFNLQFRGIGESYKLDRILPEWLDYYIFASDEKFYKETLKLHYGVNELPEGMRDKVKALGWLSTRHEKVPTREHVFVYLGSGMTQNESLLQKVVENLPKEQKIVAVSTDQVFGNFPNLSIFPYLQNFDEVLLSAKYIITHEGTATVSKAMIHGVPFVGIRGDSPLKRMETEAYNILKYGKMLNRNEITPENLQPLKEIKHVKYGVDDVYNLLVDSL